MFLSDLRGRNQDSSDVKALRGNPVSLVCTNINSMMGGQTNVWKSGRGKPSGLVGPTGRTLTQQELKLKDTSSHDDDKLEFGIMASTLHLGLGKGLRLAQEKGPFNIYFKQPVNNRPLETYMQIDGEFYKLVNPHHIEITLSPQFGHLKVLKNID